MTVDVVNTQNQRVGTLEIRDEVFGGQVHMDQVWESVVREQAASRRGTHATKNRAVVSGSGRKPWKQKGTGRARVGDIRSPLWRHGGTVFGPQPRSYAYALPRKVERNALRAALTQKVKDGALVVVDALAADEAKTKVVAEMLRRLGAEGSTLVTDVALDDKLVRAARNLSAVLVVPSGRLTARQVMNAHRLIASRAAMERLQEVLGS